jgi:hypothetical protein
MSSNWRLVSAPSTSSLHFSTSLPKKVSTADGLARLRQYKSRISQWKLDKKVKPLEMQCIVRKRQKRKLVEVDKPEQIYEVRGNRVEEAKIDRWMNTHDVPDSMLYTPSPAACKYATIRCLHGLELLM